MWVRAREIGNKKKKKKEEEDDHWVSCKSRKKNHLEEMKKFSVFTSVGPTNFDIFTIGRKKKEFFFLIWYRCKKKFLMCTFNL